MEQTGNMGNRVEDDSYYIYCVKCHKIRNKNQLACPVTQMIYENHAVVDSHAKFLTTERQAKKTRIFCNKERKNYENNVMDDGNVCKGLGPASFEFFLIMKNIWTCVKLMTSMNVKKIFK